MGKFIAPQTHNVVWLHANGVTAYDRETGYERTFYRYAFRTPHDDDKVVHIGAVQSSERDSAFLVVMERIAEAGGMLWDGTMTFEDLGPAMKAWRRPAK